MARNTGTGSRGFTIIELMVVLALVVILASLAMVQAVLWPRVSQPRLALLGARDGFEAVRVKQSHPS